MLRAPRLLPYFGSKYAIADYLVTLMPPHLHYVEAFCGSLAVLLRKPRARLETANDIDGDLVNFWRVLRDQPDALARVCQLTPWSRAEFTQAKQLPYPDDVSDVERARRVWVQLTQAHVATRTPGTGWRLYADSGGGAPPFDNWQRLATAAHRLRNVQLECRPALDVIAQFAGDPGVLLYLDPPYVAGVRSERTYLNEMPDDAAHRALASAVEGARATVMVSGFASPLYDLDLFADWHRYELRARSGYGPADHGARAGRTEVVWSNRELMAQLALPL